MSYRRELDLLGQHLAAVLSYPQPLTGAGLDAGVAGFTATTHLLRQVHGDLVGAGRHRSKDLAALERDPIPLLGRLLRDLPHLQQAAMTDVQTRPATTAAGDHWRAAARSALLAHHDWVTADPSSRPTGPAALTEIGRIAQLAEILAVLGPGLADDLRAAGRRHEAAALLARTTTGLRVTAVTVQQIVRTNLPGPLADLTPAAPRLVLPVHRPSQIAAGLHRLTTLLAGAAHVTPQHLQLLAMVGAQSASTAAHVLRRAGQTDVATALDRHGQLLTAAAGSRCHAASVRPPDPLPMVQAQELSLALAALRRGGTILPIDDAWRIAAALPDLTTALRDAAGHEVRRRRWLVPSRTTTPDAPAWVPVTAASAPALTRQLSAAAAHAPKVGAAVAGAAPASAGVAASASPTAVARHSAPTVTRPPVRRAGRAR